MLKRKLWIISLLFVCYLSANGQQVTSTEAAKAAVTIMHLESKANLTLDSIGNIFAIVNNGDSLLFEVLFINGSAVLLSGHKSCTPVLGILLAEEDEPSQGILNRLDSISPALRDLLEHYAAQIQYAKNNNLPSFCQSEWDSLLNYCDTTSETHNLRDKVSPLLNTRWGQWKSNDGGIGSAYNYNIPGCNNYDHCFTGCVATAMAQVLKFWEEPKDIPSRCNQFDWSNMTKKLNYNHNNNYIIQRDAISTLMRDCGNLVNMRYCGGLSLCNTQESGAYLDVVPNALKRYGYNNAYYASKNDYTETQWGNLLRSNLASGYPLLYRGQNSATSRAGHCFVCDGYKKKWFSSEYLYHMNWGKNGDDNSWFTLDNLHPESALGSYSYLQAAIFDIYPSFCWENIIMECDRSFSNGTVKAYFTAGKFKNNNHNYHISNGAMIVLFAGNEIVLSDGFHAEQGSFFQTVIADCSSAATIMPDYFVKGVYEDLPTDTLVSSKSLLQPDSLANDAALKVWPNPTDNHLNVELSGTEIANVAFYDLQGRVVETRHGTSLQGGTATVNLRNVPSGVYLLRVRDAEGKEYMRKIVKK